MVYVSEAALGAFLVAKVGSWGSLLAAAIAGTSYVLTNMCTVDPPADPGINALDIVAILDGPLNNSYLDAVNKVRQLLQRYLWPQFCECVSGTQPTPPGPLSPPTGTPTVDPPAIFVPPLVGPCLTYSHGPTNLAPSNSYVAISRTLDGVVGTSFRLTVSKSVASGGGNNSVHHILQQSLHPSNTLLQDDSISVGPSATSSIIVPFKPGCEFVQVTTIWQSGTGTSAVSETLETYCGGAGINTPVSPCCPPDSATSALLARINGLVTLIQRQAVPFGYVSGTVHAGLADSGSLSIADLIGIRVDVTTLPDSYGRAAGDPIQFFDLGFLSWGTADGYRSSFGLDHDGQVSFPTAAGLFTQLGYSLSPGVVVTITELVREP